MEGLKLIDSLTQMAEVYRKSMKTRQEMQAEVDAGCVDMRKLLDERENKIRIYALQLQEDARLYREKLERREKAAESREKEIESRERDIKSREKEIESRVKEIESRKKEIELQERTLAEYERGENRKFVSYRETLYTRAFVEGRCINCLRAKDKMRKMKHDRVIICNKLALSERRFNKH